MSVSQVGSLLMATGMFRSGTTLLGKCLGSHAELTVALDPMREWFREVRNRLAPPSAGLTGREPFEEQFWGEAHWKLEAYPAAALSALPADAASRERIRQGNLRASRAFAPRLCTSFEDRILRGDTLAAVFDEYLQAIEVVYGDPGSPARYTGFKEVWCEEFVPILLAQHPTGRVVHILRDPRAVVASKLAQPDSYPLRFLCRFWRKSVHQAILWQRVHRRHAERYRVIRYEDLVTAPEATLRGVCDFLGLGFDPAMLDASLPDPDSLYSRGANSSHQALKDRPGFVEEAVHRWRKTLFAEQVAFVNWMTYPERRYLGYVSADEQWEPWTDRLPPEIDAGRLATWLAPYEAEYLGSEAAQARALAREQLRRSLWLLDDADLRGTAMDELLGLTFTSAGVFEVLRHQRFD